jgi:pyruvate dehydrogenase E1 component alpha subunit
LSEDGGGCITGEVPYRSTAAPSWESPKPFSVVDDLVDPSLPWPEELAPKVAQQLLRAMVRLRRMDECLSALQRQGRIGFHGSSLGQEAVTAALGTALTASDWIMPGLRESGVLLERGEPLVEYLAEDFACSLSPGRGRQMPSHQFSVRHRVASWSSCIGTQLPHAVGVAYAAKYCREPVIAVGVMGDGATSTPDFHSAMNFAGVFHLPVVFVCQNNQYAISLPVDHQTNSNTLADKGRAYGIPAQRVDGNDAMATHIVLSRLAEKARSGGGPSFLECVTYRMGPHSSSDDPSLYRPAGQAAAWALRDPILRLSAAMVARGVLGSQQVRQWAMEMDVELSEAISLLEHSSQIPVASLFEDVYARMPWHLREQRALTHR